LTTDQVLLAAIGAVIIILIVVGVARAVTRQRTPTTGFGAGGSTTVPVGTRGMVKSTIAPSGVVLAAGEEWSARARGGAEIAEGTWVTVVAQDGLTLIVAPESGTQE
jgi:membrane protein implicated in regulation of membrane protease activity